MVLLDDDGNRYPSIDVGDEDSDIPSDSEESLPETDISDKPFRYNPPIHNANLHRRMDFGSSSSHYLTASKIYDEDTAPSSYDEEWASLNLNSLRLGRIIQHNIAPGYASLMDYRWGFRFLYNPTTLSYQASRNDSFVIDGRSETNRAISGINQNFQTIMMDVYLDRVPDVMAKDISSDDYSPGLSEGDKAGLRAYGTHWDLEALFRLCNGEWELTDRGKTSNIGVLIPSNARLVLGKGDDFFGFVESITYTDMMFSPSMVPIRTKVSLTFHRHIDMTPEQVETSFPGIGSIGTGDEDFDSGSGSGSTAGGGSYEGDGGSMTYTDSLIPSSYRSKYIKNGPQRSVSAAVSRAHDWIGKTAFVNQCIVFVTYACYGNARGSIGIPSAYMTWGNCPSNLRHPGDRNPPVGAVVLFDSSVGGGHGHAAVSIGNGKMITTTSGAIRIEKIWTSGYYGWIPPVFYGTSRRRP